MATLLFSSILTIILKIALFLNVNKSLNLTQTGARL
jgi:hypothetical protein